MGSNMRVLRYGLGLCAAILLAGALPSGGIAASPPTLFVDQGSIGGRCSDSYTISQAESPSTPWCTILHAFETAPSGSTVEVRAGTYPFQLLHGPYGRPPRLSDYVTFEPFGYGTKDAEIVTIDGVSLANTAFLRFRGFHFIGSDSATEIPAFNIYLHTAHVQLIDNQITGQGIEDYGASDVLLEGNDIHDTTYNCAIDTQLNGAGMYLIGGSAANPPITDIRVLDNRIEATAQDGIDVANAANVLIQGNDISTGVQPPAYEACGYHVDEMQFENDGRGPITVQDNTFHDGTQFILRNTADLTIANNLMLRLTGWMQLMADPDAKVVNNTWWGGDQFNAGTGSLILRGYAPGSSWTQPPFDYTNTMAGTIVANNIMRLFDVDSYVDRDQYEESNNLIYGPASNSTATGDPGGGDVFATPMFVDAASGDYQLVRGSPGSGEGDAMLAPASDMRGVPRPAGDIDIGALQAPALVGGSSAQPPATAGESLPVGVPPRAGTPSLPGALRLAVRAQLASRRPPAIRLRLRCNERCRVLIGASLDRFVSWGRAEGARSSQQRWRLRRVQAARLRTRAVALSGRRFDWLLLSLPPLPRALHSRGNLTVVRLRLLGRADGRTVRRVVALRIWMR